jgi:hypothetical protein
MMLWGFFACVVECLAWGVQLCPLPLPSSQHGSIHIHTLHTGFYRTRHQHKELPDTPDLCQDAALQNFVLETPLPQEPETKQQDAKKRLIQLRGHPAAETSGSAAPLWLTVTKSCL